MNTGRKRQGAVKRGTAGRGFRFAIVVSRFHKGITEKLRQGALRCLENQGVRREHIAVYSCPGAFELPQVANLLCDSGEFDAVICLGAVVRGATPHFEYISAEAARGIQIVALRHSLPVTFGVLTTENLQQARERAGGVQGNKGWDAASAAIEMANLFRKLRRSSARMPAHEE